MLHTDCGARTERAPESRQLRRKMCGLGSQRRILRELSCLTEKHAQPCGFRRGAAIFRVIQLDDAAQLSAAQRAAAGGIDATRRYARAEAAQHRGVRATHLLVMEDAKA